MALDHKNLIKAQLGNSIALVGTVVPASTTWYAKNITLYNTSGANVNTVEIRWGTSAAASTRYVYALDPNESFEIPLEYPWILVATEGVYASATNASEVNIFVDGAEET